MILWVFVFIVLLFNVLVDVMILWFKNRLVVVLRLFVSVSVW